MSMTLTPSKYQVAIENHFSDMMARPNTRETLVIEAKAGSGKTSTIERLCAMIPRDKTQNAIALAFNKDIVAEFGSRLTPTGVVCKTINSLGNQALWNYFRKKLTVDGYKYKNLLAGYLENMSIPKQQFGDTLSAVNTLLTFTMSSMLGYNPDGEWDEAGDADMLELSKKFGIDTFYALSEREAFNMVRAAIREGDALARSRRLISFDDQLYLSVKWNIPIPQFDFIFGDEIQDFSAVKAELALRAGSARAKFVLVGDSRQSCYGFAGAAIDSIEQIIKRTNATVLPLSVCYRCPINIVKEAQKIVKDIEWAPGAEEGIVRTIFDTQLETELREGDMVLSRTNAPLVRLAIKLIGQRIPAKIKGRDIGANLVTFAKNVLGKRGEWKNLLGLLEEYEITQTVALQEKKNSEGQIQNLKDKVACTEALYEGLNAQSLDEYALGVKNLFSDESALIELSSVHRAKGLGRDRVFIIEPEKLPLRWKGMREWEEVQESNLVYISRTRAKKEMVYVETTEKKKKAS